MPSQASICGASLFAMASDYFNNPTFLSFHWIKASAFGWDCRLLLHCLRLILIWNFTSCFYLDLERFFNQADDSEALHATAFTMPLAVTERPLPLVIGETLPGSDTSNAVISLKLGPTLGSSVTVIISSCTSTGAANPLEINRTNRKNHKPMGRK